MKRWLLALGLTLAAVFSWGHDPALSGIGIATTGQTTTVAVRIHLGKLTGDHQSDITRRLQLSIDGKPFEPRGGAITEDAVAGIGYWKASFPGVPHQISVQSRLFPEQADSRTVVTVTRDGHSVLEKVVDAEHPSLIASLDSPRTPIASVVGQFFRIGIDHIFSGLDHILFVVGLILLGGGLKPLLKTVTAFTVAHSITLTLATTGVFAPPSRFIEPLIALSIVAIAIENLRQRPAEGAKDWRPLIAFGFGLIHGFGFAGGLTEVGMPADMLGWALASFNLGVECAQAVIVCATVPFLSLLATKKPDASRWLVTGGSVAIAVIGGWWFVDRLMPQSQPPAEPVAAAQPGVRSSGT